MSTTFEYNPMALSHSFNSRGELGMFVNPYNCSCGTCNIYKANQERADESEAVDALLMLAQQPVLAPLPDFGGPIGLGRSITGFHYRPSDDREDTGTIPASPLPAPPIAEEVVLGPEQAQTIRESLQDYIQVLRERQDQVYDSRTRSHDEMAAQDQEWEELDRKIMEIDSILELMNRND